MRLKAKSGGRGRVVLAVLAFLAIMAFLGAACGASEPAPPESPELYVLSNSSPHVSVIDTDTNRGVRHADIPGLTLWSWNDDNNYYDGQNLWLGMRDPDSDEAEVVALDLDSLTVASRLAIGKEKETIYIGKVALNGVLHVSMQESGRVVTIDSQGRRVLDTWDDVPLHGGVVCDADIATGQDGVQRFYYPTRQGNTVVSLDPETGETIKVFETPDGTTPHMLTTAPDGRVWVQELGTGTTGVYDPVTLDLVGRIPSARGPVISTFTRDGRYAFIGHASDPVVQVLDTATLEEVQRITVGANPSKLAVRPSGDFVYAILTKEASVAVIDTGSWEVIKRIPLGTDSTGIYLRFTS